MSIFRLVSEHTIEENILKKANQKRLLGDLAIEGGSFTTAYFKSVSYKRKQLFSLNKNKRNLTIKSYIKFLVNNSRSLQYRYNRRECNRAYVRNGGN